jgi:predicted ABC-type ATPase
VNQGGHGVPEDTIRRRYHRGIENFFRIYKPLADEWRFYDNSEIGGPRLIAGGGSESGEEIIDGASWRRARPRE